MKRKIISIYPLFMYHLSLYLFFACLFIYACLSMSIMWIDRYIFYLSVYSPTQMSICLFIDLSIYLIKDYNRQTYILLWFYLISVLFARLKKIIIFLTIKIQPKLNFHILAMISKFTFSYSYNFNSIIKLVSWYKYKRGRGRHKIKQMKGNSI